MVFLGIDTEPLADGLPIPGYDPLGWLESALRQSAGQPVIVFHHTPSVDDFYDNRVHATWKPEARKKWDTLINAYDVRAVLTGHFHRDELHWDGKVPVYVAAPVANFWGREGSYRIYEYRDGRLGYRTMYLDK